MPVMPDSSMHEGYESKDKRINVCGGILMNKVGVIGAGTWGMALARMLANNKSEVTVWTRHGEKLDEYKRTGIYPKLNDMRIPESIIFDKTLDGVCRDKDILLIAVPSVYVRQTVHAAAEFIADGQIIVNVAKGMEHDSLLTLSEVIEDELSHAGKSVVTVALSGPTHAEEVAKDLPSSIVSASYDSEAAKRVQDIFMNTCMRVYTNSDRKGVELCGAMKNIMALAAGISQGLGYGDNAKAALITRGLAEITRLGTAMGCKRETFSGLAGVGDLIVTATSMNSRNNRAGILIGRGMTADEARAEIGMVVEGINALPAAIELAEKYHIDMPLTLAVDAIINKHAAPGEAVLSLMKRDKRAESDE